jgi:two-component system sensor histidine kinase KdpD
MRSLQEADRFKSALLSSVSHDLRSPLMAISTSVESLADESVQWSAEDRAAFIGTIQAESARLTATVNNLLEMSRVEGGAITPHLEPIDAGQLVEEVTIATAERTRGRQIEAAAPDETWFRGDWGLVLQSMTNLVENAAKYSTPGRPINIDATRNGSQVLLSVADGGPGIAGEDLPHIFEKFYRGSGASKTKGSGLGLSIVKAMVELSGGQVSVESSAAGTRFTLAFPVAAAPR